MAKSILIVGAGFYGAVCARELTDAGYNCLVLDKREHIGGNCFTRYCEEAGCHQHVYGPHIFHTSCRRVWDYVNRFAEFREFVNRPKVFYQGKIYSFPINLLTLYQLFGVRTPSEAKRHLEAVREPIENPQNLEEWCLSKVGREIYEIFIEGYTFKQWQREPRELPASLIRRLPIRLTFEDNYYRDRYQGVPVGGYTALFEKLLKGIPVELGADFLSDRDGFLRRFDHVIYSGPIDAFFGYGEGVLEYRTLKFANELVNQPDFQGVAQMNFTERRVPFTRIVEHKHFHSNSERSMTLITREYPQAWKPGMIEFYPVNTNANQAVYQRYRKLITDCDLPVTFGDRLGDYRYYDMHQVIGAALERSRKLILRDFETMHVPEKGTSCGPSPVRGVESYPIASTRFR